MAIPRKRGLIEQSGDSPAKRRNVGAAQDGNHNESPADGSNKDKVSLTFP